MASLYKRGNRYWIAYTLMDRRVVRSLFTSNLRIARDKKRKIEYELAIGDLQQESKLPLVVVLDAFCTHLEATRTYKSFKNDFSRLRIFFGPVCTSLELRHSGPRHRHNAAAPPADRYAHAHVKVKLLEDVSPEMINRFVSERITNDRWAPKTVNLMRQVLHRLFNYAVKHHGFRARDRRYPNPAAAVERMREPAPQIRFLTREQIIEQLEVVRDAPVIHALVATLIYAGLRREEALWLTHEDVDITTRVLRIRAKTMNSEFWQPKTKRNRTVPISETLFALLKEYEPSVCVNWFFPSPTGKRWSPDNFSNDLRKINTCQNLPWSCLDFRHTFGSHLAQKGESLFKIATMMGNSPDICRKHYAALIPELMHDAAEFGSIEKGKNLSSDASQLLMQILSKMNGEDETKDEGPHLKIVP